MSTEIQCPRCRTPNPAGSKFCNKCGEPLPVDAPLNCSQCGAENPAHLLYCDRCGARLVAESEPPEPEEPQDSGTFEGFSLPARPPGETGDLDIDHIPEWLRTGRVELTDESGETGVVEWDDLPDDAGVGDRESGEQDDRIIEDWLADLDEEDDTLPGWLEADDALLQNAESGGPAPDPAESDEEPDVDADEPVLPTWLREQTGPLSEPPPPETDPAETPAEEPEPDLSGMSSLLGDLPGDESEEDAGETGESAVDLSGFTHWLEDLHTAEPPPDARAASGAGEEEEEAETDAEDEPETDADVETPAETPEAPEEEVAPFEAEAWLAELDAASPDAETGDEAWLAALDQGDESARVDSTGDEDWLADLDEAQIEEPAADAGGDPDAWLADLDEAQMEEPVADAGDDPDAWLSQLDVAPAAPEEEQPPAESGAEEDWLAQLGAVDDGSAMEPADDEVEEEDWLEQLGGAAEPAPDLGAAREAPAAGDLPEAEADQPPPDLAADEVAPPAGVDGVLPDWMDELAAAGEDEEEEEASVPRRGSDEGMPAWLGDILPDDVRGEMEAEQSALERPEALPEEEEEASSAPRFSHWLSQEAVDEGEEAGARKGPAPESDVDVSYDDMPEWLQPEEDDFESALEAALAVQGAEMLPTMGEDWLDLLSDVPEEVDAPPAEDLEPAEIPEWLSELQPSAGGAVAPPPPPEETTGPLAGLRGVIDIEPVIALPRKSSPRRSLTASREQKQQAALLQRLTQAELTRPPLVARQRPAALPIWLRWTLGLLLLAAVAAGLLFGEQVLGTVTPPVLPAGAAALQETVAATQEGTVLVAFDYPPAFSGELTPQVDLLVQQLAAGGNRFVTVSQSAAGAALAREAIPGATALGYLPGESIGLRQLANCLPRLDACQNLLGRPLPAGIEEIDLIVLVTGERDSFTAWLEQVDAQTGSLPFVAAVTEGVAPIANPYYDSGQLDGLLAGLPIAAAYESAYDVEGDALRLYRARALASWLAITLLVVGNLVFLLTWRTSQRKRRRQQTKPIGTEGS